MFKKKYKNGFKICRTYQQNFDSEEDKFKDCDYISGFSLGINMIYELKKWTKRMEGCGPLAVFNNYHFAKDFLNEQFNNFMLSILKCKYKKSKTNFLYYTNNEGEEMRNYCIEQFPFGTRFADKVKLIKEV